MGSRIFTISRSAYQFSFDRLNKPVAHISSGDRVIFETEDANCSFIQKESDMYPDFSVLYKLAGGCNPVTGPVYVEEAMPGDYLAVTLERVIAAPVRHSGYTCITPGFGALSSPYGIQDKLPGRTKICRVGEESFAFPLHDSASELKIPLNPFVGTIGVAPSEDRRSSFYHGKDYCGNVDCKDIKEGATVVLPVNHPGALLSLGDVHAAQGEGEITGCALECQGSVQVQVHLLKAQEAMYGEFPQVNTAESIGSLVCLGGIALHDAIRAGYVDLVNRMNRYYGFDKLDAYQLLCLCGEVVIGQLLEGMYSCLTKIRRSLIEK